MSISVIEDADRQLINVVYEGTIKDDDMFACDTLVRNTGAYHAGFPILCDCSRLKPGDLQVTGKGLFKLKDMNAKRENRVAIVAGEDFTLGLAQTYGLIVNWCSERIRVFTAVDDALEWLKVAAELVCKLSDQPAATGAAVRHGRRMLTENSEKHTTEDQCFRYQDLERPTLGRKRHDGDKSFLTRRH